MYGESVFTTMRMVNGDLQDWSRHFERLRKGVEFLYGPFLEGHEWFHLLKNRLDSRLLGQEGDKVVRLTVYREQARGLLKSPVISVHDLKLHIHFSDLDSSRFENKRLKLRSCPVIRKPAWWPSYLKAGNYLETILCQKVHMKEGDDDILFLNGTDVLESSVANIFSVRKNVLYTAPPGPNVLEGIMRQKVLECAHEFFERVQETPVMLENILKADAVFGSNSVRGLFLVDRIDDYEITYSESFLEKFRVMGKRVLV